MRWRGDGDGGLLLCLYGGYFGEVVMDVATLHRLYYNYLKNVSMFLTESTIFLHFSTYNAAQPIPTLEIHLTRWRYARQVKHISNIRYLARKETDSAT